jgi:hypothetical protein
MEAGQLRYDSQQGQVIFLFATTSRWYLETTHSAYWGAIFPGVKEPGCEADHSPPSDTKVKNAWS